MIQKGQRVHSILYGGRNGIVFNIIGEQRPETIKELGGGLCVMGGNADFDIVWDDGTISHQIPEAIIHGVQWHIYEKVASEEEIKGALEFAAKTKVEEQEKKKLDEARFEKEKEMLPSLYPWLITKERAGGLSDPALAAKNIKIELARAFPGISFSVRSKQFSGGDDVNVSWRGDKVKTEEVEAIISKYQEGHFDGMDDNYHYAKSPWFEVFGSAKYTFAQQERL
jgi:hypothetical protein